LANALLFSVTDSIWNLFVKRFMTQFSQLVVRIVYLIVYIANTAIVLLCTISILNK